MVAKSDEQVEEQLAASVEHLELHGAASLESAPAANDEGKIVRPQFGVSIRCIGVCVTGRRKDCTGLNSRLYGEQLVRCSERGYGGTTYGDPACEGQHA